MMKCFNEVIVVLDFFVCVEFGVVMVFLGLNGVGKIMMLCILFG